MTTGFYAGSFDPPHLGHIDVATRAAKLFDKLVIGIGTHPTKKPLFDLTTRKKMLTACLNNIKNIENEKAEKNKENEKNRKNENAEKNKENEKNRKNENAEKNKENKKAKNTQIELISFDGLTLRAANSHKAHYLVRSIRNQKDYTYETEMAQANALLNGGLPTLFFPPNPTLSHISSSLLKEILEAGGDVSPFIPKNIKPIIEESLTNH